MLSQWKIEAETLEQIWPKKESLTHVKWCAFSLPDHSSSYDPIDNSREHISIYALHGEPLFFQHFDGPFYPTLRILHKCMFGGLLHDPQR